jgi:outer membrane receptor protein involved in Fe transport
MTLNAAVFTSLMRDVQRRVATLDEQGMISQLSMNVGKSVVQGAEIDWSAMLLPRLVLSSSLALRAARYQEFDAPSPSGRSFKNTRIPNLPTYTMDFALDYSLPLARLGELAAKLTWKHEGTKGTQLSDPQYTRVHKHGVLGGRIGFDLADGVTSVALFGANLLDREYFAVTTDFAGANGTTQRFYAPPRTYGIELTRKF